MLSDWAYRLADKVAGPTKPAAPAEPPRVLTPLEQLATYQRLLDSKDGLQKVVEKQGEAETRRYVNEMERLRRTLGDPSLQWGTPNA